MKGLFRLIVIIGVGLCSFLAKAEDIFADLTKFETVESTYISGRFAHNKKYWYSNTGQHTMDLSRGFSAMYTYECNSKETVSTAVKILCDYVKKTPELELVMKSVQGSEDYRVYEKFNSEDKLVQMIIWSQDSPASCEIVVIDWKNGLEPTRSPYN